MSNIKTYQIPFSYKRYGRITVKATSIADAYNRARDKFAKITVSQMAEMTTYLPYSNAIELGDTVINENGHIINE